MNDEVVPVGQRTQPASWELSPATRWARNKDGLAVAYRARRSGSSCRNSPCT